MSALSFCEACGVDCTDQEHVPASGVIARGLRVAADAVVCAGCSARRRPWDIGEVVCRVIRDRLVALGFDGAGALSAEGDALLDRRPLTRDVKDLACACWLAADGHYEGAAEALAPDGDGAAWVAREAAAMGVEVQS